MNKKKALIGSIITLALLAMQVGAAYAASPSQNGTITGTVQSVTQSTDSSGNPIFLVTIAASGGTTQTVKLSAAEAVSLGLVTANKDGTYTINNVVGTTVSIAASMAIANPCSESESGIVASALAAFFCQGSSTVLDNTIGALHAQGFGFGEIAQACFMAEALNSTCGDILTAKQNHDFSSLGLPSNVTNWGQLRKFALAQEVKSLTNLGAIMSGRAASTTTAGTAAPTPMAPNAGGNGNGHGHGQGGQGGHGNGNGNGHKP